jgi:ABC-2 type transport system permease protein
MSVSRMLTVYAALFFAALKAKFNYRADFWIILGSTVLVQSLGYIFLWVVFRQIPAVAGWTLWEAVCVYAMIFITEGFVSFFFEGLWRLNWLLYRGEFDSFLVRPVPPLLQVIVCDVGLNGLGNILLGGAMLAQAFHHLAIDWTPLKVLVAVVLLISAVLVRVATVLASATLGFWIGSPYNSIMFVVHSLSDLARFPLPIYGRGLRAMLTFGVPFAFVSYYPAAWVLAKAHVGWIGLLTPLVALVGLSAAAWAFRRGLQSYEGAGN